MLLDYGVYIGLSGELMNESFHENLDEYMAELDKVYRRAMDTPLEGLSSVDAMLVKNFQMSAKMSKDKLKELQPEMLRCYENAQSEERQAMEQDLRRLQSELRVAWAELEIALQKRS